MASTGLYNGWDKYFKVIDNVTVLPEKKKEAPPKTHDILIVAGTMAEARELADMMGWEQNAWVYVHRFEVMLQYPSKSVYIYGTARERKDFGAIEGLFLRGNHEVMDMDE